ncbi:MAG: glycosyltransferase family 39 protein [Candidatus Micrarchaeia archaeon]
MEIHEYPFRVMLYTPLYFILAAFSIKVLGLSLSAGRILSFLSSLISGFLLYLIIKTKTGDRRTAAFSSLLFFSLPHVLWWGPQFRPDMLALLLSLLGIHLSLHEKYMLAIPVFLTAFYTKQTALAAPVGIFVSLLFKNRKQAFYFVFLFLFFLTTTFILIDFITNGKFSLNILYYNLMQPFSLSRSLMFAKEYLCLYGALFVISFLTIRDASLLSLYFFVSHLSILLMGRAGMTYNQWLEPLATLCLMVPISYKKMNGNKLFTAFLILSQLLFITHAIGFSPVFKPLPQCQSEIIYVKNFENPMVVEGAYYPMMAGKEVLYNDIQVFTYLFEQGIWDASPLTKKCEKRELTLVWGETILKIPEVKECLETTYRKGPYGSYVRD